MNAFLCTGAHPPGEQSGDIRLFGDPRNGYGAVEIYSNMNGWQGICPDSSWTDSDAVTICQDLGYASGAVAEPINVISNLTIRVPSFRLHAANCPPSAGDPLTLGVCSFLGKQFTISDCPLNQFAAVNCSKYCGIIVTFIM